MRGRGAPVHSYGSSPRARGQAQNGEEKEEDDWANIRRHLRDFGLKSGLVGASASRVSDFGIKNFKNSKKVDLLAVTVCLCSKLFGGIES